MERLSFFISDLLILEIFACFISIIHCFLKKYTLIEFTDKIRLEVALDFSYYLKIILFLTIILKCVLLIAPIKWW